tara:strand:- start:14 stop:619 length:606 start_codon:yes stop_codon:yes gene_type:complete
MALLFANNNSLSAITTKPSGLSGGIMTLLSTQTASSSATISFTSGIDSTYDEYVFKFIDIHPATDEAYLTFQGNAAGGSGYNETITSTDFRAYNAEDGSATALQYSTAFDQAQGTSFQPITQEIGNDNDQCASGTLQIFAPSDTTFVKHFLSASQYSWAGDYTMRDFTAGYFNTTSAIDEIQFKMSSGNIDSGVIKLYGIS